MGRPALCRGAVWPPPRGALDAPGWTAGRPATAVVAETVFWTSSKWDAESSGPGFQRHDTQHQMGDRYHLYSDHRALVVSLCRAGFVFRAGRRVVDECRSGPSAGGPRGAHGVVAAASPHPGYPALRSGVSVYLRGIPTVPGGASGDLEHECGGQVRR